MPTTNVNLRLSADLAAFVESEVSADGCGRAEEVVRDPLRLLRREVAVGLADAEAGRVSTRSVAGIAEAVLRGEPRGA